jgi:hypothetical protein
MVTGGIDCVDASHVDRSMIQFRRRQKTRLHSVGQHESWLVGQALAGHSRGQQRIAVAGTQVT